MRKNILLLALSLTLLACGGVKKTQEAINYGNYDEAIEIALKHLRNNKTKKGNQSYVLMLEEAFLKVTNRDLEKIEFLQKDGNPANLEAIYSLFTSLDKRQEKIKPLLPLPIHAKKRNAKFVFNDYTNNIITSKNQLSEYLYNNARLALSTSNNKFDYRDVYGDLKFVDDINPNYKNTRSLMDEAHFKGTDFVFVTMQNKTNQVIPIRLEEDLLNFDTYRLNDFWTVYHNNKQPDFNYDFEMVLNLREINISPELIREKELSVEKEIKDGWEYLHDENGTIVKDSSGVKIKVDTFKNVRAKLFIVTQSKSTQVIGQVNYINLKTNQLIESFPIASEFVFEHRFATFSGNRDALDKNQLRLTNQREIPFPSNEQMVYDTGEDLKLKIKNIISRNRFR